MFCKSDFYFLTRRKKCKVATYNFDSLYNISIQIFIKMDTKGRLMTCISLVGKLQFVYVYVYETVSLQLIYSVSFGHSATTTRV